VSPPVAAADASIAESSPRLPPSAGAPPAAPGPEGLPVVAAASGVGSAAAPTGLPASWAPGAAGAAKAAEVALHPWRGPGRSHRPQPESSFTV
jgi:hypothetical protein